LKLYRIRSAACLPQRLVSNIWWSGGRRRPRDDVNHCSTGGTRDSPGRWRVTSL